MNDVGKAISKTLKPKLEEMAEDKINEGAGHYGLNINALAYYMYNADYQQFKDDMFRDSNFVDSYMRGKFSDFQDNFPHFLYNLDKNHRGRFASACMKMYLKHNR